jgi:pimeloyl-ACP methyl ester carboxylesterase
MSRRAGRLPWAFGAAALLVALVPSSASAAFRSASPSFSPSFSASASPSPFKRCYRGAGIDCAIVSVPLDRTGRVAGTVPLHAVRVRARRPIPPGTPRSAVVGLAGGPGQSALPLLEDIYATISPALATRDLILFDQRGTGLSGLLHCRSLERRPIGNRIKAVGDCASSIGPGRAFYTTRDSADDIEAVRVAAGADTVVPYGTSYGTKVALAYAQRYPQRTERLVLDSLVDLDGPDPFSRDELQAIPRVLRDLCGRAACAGVSPDPVGDLTALVKTIETKPLSGFVVGGDGKRRARLFGRTAMLGILFEGDFDPQLRADFPAAVRSALARDAAPMLRLANKAMVNDYFPDPPISLSPALFTATTCEEGPLPWDPALPFGDRWQLVFQQTAAMPDSVFAPFDRAIGRSADTLRLCAPWPASGPQAPPDPRPLPDVPALILGGAADLRTPIENDARLVARLPHASTVAVPNAGHSVLDSDLSGCADEATRAFFAGKPVPTACSRLSTSIQRLLAVLYAPTPVPPRALSSLSTPRRLPGRPGRTVRAVELGFFDAIASVLGSTFDAGARVTRIGGLRGGRLVARSRPKMTLRLDRYSYVPGVWVSAELGDLSRRNLHLRVGGRRAAPGRVTLRLKRDLITGRLGGKRVHLRLSSDIGEAIGGLYELRRLRHGGGPALGRCCSASQVLPPR